MNRLPLYLPILIAAAALAQDAVPRPARPVPPAPPAPPAGPAAPAPAPRALRDDMDTLREQLEVVRRNFNVDSLRDLADEARLKAEAGFDAEAIHEQVMAQMADVKGLEREALAGAARASADAARVMAKGGLTGPFEKFQFAAQPMVRVGRSGNDD